MKEHSSTQIMNEIMNKTTIMKPRFN